MIKTLRKPKGINLVVCPTCSVRFWITTDLRRLRQKDYHSFWCPNGHRMTYSLRSSAPSDSEKLIASLRDIAATSAENERKALDKLRALSERNLIQRVLNIGVDFDGDPENE